MLNGQIRGQSLKQFLAVAGPGLSALIEFDDSPANLPVSGCQDAVDRTSRSPTRFLKQP